MQFSCSVRDKQIKSSWLNFNSKPHAVKNNEMVNLQLSISEMREYYPLHKMKLMFIWNTFLSLLYFNQQNSMPKTHNLGMEDGNCKWERNISRNISKKNHLMKLTLNDSCVSNRNYELRVNNFRILLSRDL